MMERSEILTAMGQLKLFGMRAAFDEIAPYRSSALRFVHVASATREAQTQESHL